MPESARLSLAIILRPSRNIRVKYRAMNDPDEVLRAQLNAETGKLSWKELERHYARGVVIKVAVGLDLVNVAAHIVRDDKPTVEAWLASGQVARASSDDARSWHDRDATLWAVVAAPWVLVQEAVVTND